MAEFLEGSSSLSEKLANLRSLINNGGSAQNSFKENTYLPTPTKNVLQLSMANTYDSPYMQSMSNNGMSFSANSTSSSVEATKKDFFNQTQHISPQNTKIQFFQTEELRLLKEHNQYLYSKISSMEEAQNSNLQRLKSLEEENMDTREIIEKYKRELENAQKEMSKMDRLKKDECNKLIDEKEKLALSNELLEQKLNALHQSQTSHDTLRRELEDSIKEKMDFVAEMQTQLNECKLENQKHTQHVEKLKRELKNVEQELQQEKLKSEKTISTMKEEFETSKAALEEQNTKLFNDWEAEKQKNKQTVKNAQKELGVFHEQIDQVHQQLLEIQKSKQEIEQENQVLNQNVRFLQTKIENLQEVINQQKNNMVNAQKITQQLQKDKEKVEKDMKDMELEYADHKHELENEIEKLENELDRSQAKNKELSQQVNNQLQEAVSLNEKVREAERGSRYQLDIVEKEKSSLTSEYNRIKDLYTVLQLSKEELSQKYHDLIHQQEIDKQAYKSAYENQQKLFIEESVKQKNEITHLHNFNLEMKAKADEFMKEIIHLQEKLKTVMNENETLEEKSASYSKHIEQMKVMIEKAKKQVEAEMKLEFKALEEQIVTLKKQNENLKTSKAELQSQLEMSIKNARMLENETQARTENTRQLESFVASLREEADTLQLSIQNANEQVNLYARQLEESRREKEDLRKKLLEQDKLQIKQSFSPTKPSVFSSSRSAIDSQITPKTTLPSSFSTIPSSSFSSKYSSSRIPEAHTPLTHATSNQYVSSVTPRYKAPVDQQQNVMPKNTYAFQTNPSWKSKYTPQ